MTAYEPITYWSDLLGDRFDESAVGYPQLARSLNMAMHLSMERSVERALKEADLDPSSSRILDVGAGTGLWIDFWRRKRAADLAGVDLTETAVARLRERWPQHEFTQADIGAPDPRLPTGNDIVSAMSVLLHILDETRFRRALANLAGTLRSGGTLILIEPVVVHRWWGPPFGDESNSKARPLSDYCEALASAGLEVRFLRPATVCLANVVDTRTAIAFRLFDRYWSLLTRAVGRRERVGTVASAVLRPLDLVGTRLVKAGPSAKVLIARRTR